ncbi:MAG: prolipoprotein diacylglyceryl transferase family protein [Planctomycetota bacterium]
MFGNRIFYTLAMILASATTAYLLRLRMRRLSGDSHSAVPIDVPEEAPMTVEQKVLLGVGGFVGATLAAKLPWFLAAILSARTDVAPPISAPAGLLGVWFADGKTVLWALVGGYVGVEVAKWLTGIRRRTGDAFTVPVAFGIAIGRLGCLLFGCCYGVPTTLPWGVCFPMAIGGGDLPRHPTQLYESLFHAGYALLVWQIVEKRRWRPMVGNSMPAYLAVYAVFRFLTEFIRPEAVWWAGLTFYQLSSLGVFATFFWVLIARFLGKKP